ncbi:hypothetical protein [Pseudaquabacterium rugosum]|uniref:Pectate lyase domain-containing protein n=1 Tax=Pseudaquabacterium rugosum TaxID=2984194 RepID=A0ABU9BIE8_9BURK
MIPTPLRTRLAGALLAAAAITGNAQAAPLVDGLLLQATSTDIPLLGAADGYTTAGPQASAMLDSGFGAIEFLDAAADLFIDLQDDGLIAVYGFRDGRSGSLTIDIMGLGQPLGAVQALQSVAGLDWLLVDGHTLRIRFDDVDFDPSGSPWTARLQAVPEPGALALSAVALGALALLRRRPRRHGRASTAALSTTFTTTFSTAFTTTVAAAAGLLPAGDAAAEVARQVAPSDGWAAMAGGTSGGAAAAANQIYTVSSRSELLTAIALGAGQPKIIKVVGTIDMSEGQPYTSAADQRSRALVRLPSNTTLIGAGPGAGFVNAWITIQSVSNVIVRNLKIVAPCDAAPVWDPSDGATGAWNAAYDAISVIGADHVWIDRNTFTDLPLTDATLPLENGVKKQCHDGALDITKAADLVSVTNNLFDQHDKTMLIGSSDSGATAAADVGKLRVTLAGNVFRGITQRAPRVRFGQVHLYNNYFEGAKTAAAYPHLYSVGIGKSAQVLSQGNLFAIGGAAPGQCAAILTTLNADGVSFFRDGGSVLNGAALGACAVSSSASWSPPYAAAVRPAAVVKAAALATAGAGRLTTTISGSGLTGGLPGTRVPANGQSQVHIDTPLSIAFDGPPTLGSSGTIQVWRDDGTLVDTLEIGTAPSASDTQTVIERRNLEINAIGAGAMPEGRARWVFYRPVTIEGNRATIRLRDNRLAPSTTYRVTIAPGVLQGTINGAAFNGIAAGGWSFTTRGQPASSTEITVGASGATPDFRTVQGALNWVMSRCATTVTTWGCASVTVPKTITVLPGRYAEMLVLRNVANLTLAGTQRDAVQVFDQNFESLNRGSGATAAAPGTDLTTSGKVPGHRILGGGRSVFLVENADLLQLRDFTLANTHARGTLLDNQAEAIYFNTSTTSAAARLVARRMNFLSEQDTLQLKGYVWVHDTLVAGNVDFIWGNVMAALFEDSEIRSVADSAGSSPGYILQSRATPGDAGFVFLNSRLTAGPGVSQAYLARSGGTTATSYADSIAFIGTRMGGHILPVGWCVGTGTSRTGTAAGSCGSNPPPWSGTADGGATETTGWREWGSLDAQGAPLDVSARLGTVTVTAGGLPRTVTLARQLGAPGALALRAEVFRQSTIATGAPGGWVPAP